MTMYVSGRVRGEEGRVEELGAKRSPRKWCRLTSPGVQEERMWEVREKQDRPSEKARG